MILLMLISISLVILFVIVYSAISYRNKREMFISTTSCDSLSASSYTLAYGLTAEQQQEILNTHNERRAQHDTKPLKWNNELAKAANDWYSKSCEFSHSSLPYGENLIAGYRYPPCDSWYTSEICALDFQNPTFNAGHTSAMLWANTTDVGCALITKSQCPNNISDKGSTERFTNMLVCEYNPPGNIYGQFKANLHPPLVPPNCLG
jgi:hypothetical protein